MSLALMAVFVVVSCSNEDEFAQEQQKDQPLTTENIQSMQNFVRSFARFHKNTTPIVEKRMARTRSTAADNQRDIEAIQQQVEMLGESAQQMFMEIGFTEQELNNLCPLENKEVYALAGVQMLSVMSDGMPDIIDACPEEPGGEEFIHFDGDRAMQSAADCAGAILGINLIPELIEGFAPAIPAIMEGTFTMKMFKELGVKIVFKVGSKFASTLSKGPAILAVEWGICWVWTYNGGRWY